MDPTHELGAAGPDFRAAMSQLATGVVLVTTHLDGEPWGTTVSACCSVSMDPPLLLVSLSRGCVTEQALTREGCFGVSILDDALLEVARLGSAPGRPKFIAHLCVEPDPADARPPAIEGAPVHVDCDVDRRVEAGDHVLFLGLVRRVAVTSGSRPLLYFARQFRTLHDGRWHRAEHADELAHIGGGYSW